MIIVILQFNLKNVDYEKKPVLSLKNTGLTETRVKGTENNLWTFELDPIIFLDFTDKWRLKYKEIDRVVQNLFWGVYFVSTLLFIAFPLSRNY